MPTGIHRRKKFQSAFFTEIYEWFLTNKFHQFQINLSENLIKMTKAIICKYNYMPCFQIPDAQSPNYIKIIVNLSNKY